MTLTRNRDRGRSDGVRGGRRLSAACAVGAFALALVAGCATSPTQAPVVERSTPVGDPPPEQYVVQPRDSLYAIAWRYGLDYVAVARWNGIGPPYTIYPGQTLVLAPGAGVREARPARPARPPDVSAESSVPRAEPATPAPRRTITPTAPVVRAPGVPDQAPARPAAPRNPVKPATRPTAPESKRPAPAPREAAPRKAAPPQRVAGTPGPRWRWPVDVQPERGFGGDNKGVDYAVPPGRSVVAAAPGKVVYSGPGLAGYRHLVIVEHGGGYLSAYSLNADPEVGEGTDLGAGARLAAIGGTSATDRRFHFEVRRHGSPIDPGRVIGR